MRAGIGLASLEHRVPITPNTVFDIGSTSKQFTAFSILLLERDGKLSLDDDVRKHVPELQPMADVTVRHLLHHTSGLRDYLTLWALAGMKTENWTTQADAVRLAARQRRGNFPAGDEWLYSNTGYLLLGEIVQRVSGQSLREFAAATDLQASRHGEHVLPGLAHRGDSRARHGLCAEGGGGFSVDMSDFEQTGDGAVQTTVEDLLRWDSNFYDPKVGDRALLERAQTVGALASGKKLDYAAGLMIGTYRGLPTVRHGGSWAGYRADLLRFPTARTSIACLCNVGSSIPSVFADRVADIVLAAQLAPKAGSAASRFRRGCRGGAGQARGPGRILRARRDRGLPAPHGEGRGAGGVRRSVSRPSRPTVSWGRRQGSSSTSRRSARPACRRCTSSATAGMPRYAGASCRQPARTSPSLPGSTYSDELDATWTLASREGRLTVQILHDPPTPLDMVKPDVFVADQGLVLRFERDGGAVARASVQAGRVTNLVFARR